MTQDFKKKESLFSGVNRVRFSDFAIAFVILLLSLTCIIPFIHIAAKSISSSASAARVSKYMSSRTEASLGAKEAGST